MESIKERDVLPSGQTTNTTADRVLITYYTDPLCCWSWALEAHWKKLRDVFKDQIHWKYVMGGMIQDWNSYNDPMNSINKPLQFGPVWMHASQVSGVPMDSSIWHTDPPASSFPSCIAVKCASLQSAKAEESLLLALRRAAMTQAKNISKERVLLGVAEELSRTEPEHFSLAKFQDAWQNGSGIEAFKHDLQQTRFLKIGRYPTLTFTTTKARGIMITGYRPYDVLKEALDQMLIESSKKNPPCGGF